MVRRSGTCRSRSVKNGGFLDPSSVRDGLSKWIAHTNCRVPSSRFVGPCSGTKLWASEIIVKSFAIVAPFSSRL